MDSNVLQYLKDNGYLLSVDGKVVVTNKFYRDIGAATPGKLPKPTTVSKVEEPTKEDYVNFIKEAEIPTMIHNGYGSKFFANRYSHEGFKGYKQAIAEHGRDILLAATKYYYKQNNTARVMVGNFFKEGIYESFVDDVKKALEKRNSKVASLGQSTDYPVLGTFTIPEEESSNNELG